MKFSGIHYHSSVLSPILADLHSCNIATGLHIITMIRCVYTESWPCVDKDKLTLATLIIAMITRLTDPVTIFFKLTILLEQLAITFNGPPKPKACWSGRS